MMLLGRRRLHGLQLILERRGAPIEPAAEGVPPLDQAPERPAALFPFRERSEVTQRAVQRVGDFVAVADFGPDHLFAFLHGLFLLSWSCGQPDRVSFETIFPKPRAEPSAQSIT